MRRTRGNFKISLRLFHSNVSVIRLKDYPLKKENKAIVTPLK
jgi:hypothetical protein